jgi:hypothetical protein
MTEAAQMALQNASKTTEKEPSSDICTTTPTTTATTTATATATANMAVASIGVNLVQFAMRMHSSKQWSSAQDSNNTDLVTEGKEKGKREREEANEVEVEGKRKGRNCNGTEFEQTENTRGTIVYSVEVLEVKLWSFTTQILVLLVLLVLLVFCLLSFLETYPSIYPSICL